MNYHAIYENLILKRLKESPDSGEVHHILPRCLGGSDKPFNLVLLTWREHFVAHRLLCKMYPDNEKLRYAVYIMTLIQSDKNRKPTSKDIAVARRYLSEAAKLRTFNPGKTEASRKKARERMLSSSNPIKADPSKNHTAKPVIVTYLDGRQERYEYAALVPIPYGTVKWIKKHGKESPKHGILSIKNCEG